MGHDDRAFLSSKDEMIARYGATEAEAVGAFYEGNDSGAELVFTDSGVAIWLPVGVRSGDDFLLNSLARVELNYPFQAGRLDETVDDMQLLFDAYCRVQDLTDEELHDVTETAKGLQELEADDGSVALDALAGKVTCARCGRNAPLLLHDVELRDLYVLDVDSYARNLEDLSDGRGEQIRLQASCPGCDHVWPINADLGDLL